MTEEVLDPCQWCGGRRSVDPRGLMVCGHCDYGHPRPDCVLCANLADTKAVFEKRGGRKT